ncbi:hypothetical protein BSKO_04159 [Bryopsis sp. KO-2023]|nr:hypothetical protein BSKO_04159 [Bryopsis sp. KO-2023]
MSAIQHAPKLWAKAGTASAKMPVTQNIMIGLALGCVGGGFFKIWHWNEKKKINQYYHDLEKLQKQQ